MPGNNSSTSLFQLFSEQVKTVIDYLQRGQIEEVQVAAGGFVHRRARPRGVSICLITPPPRWLPDTPHAVH